MPTYGYDQIEKIEQWLDEYNIKDPTIRLDGVVDVDGDVRLTGCSEYVLPVQFGRIKGFLIVVLQN
jgi:hypothetical protein